MELLHVFLASIGSIIALFILTKIMGNREMSQLSMFDYINGITIGSIAAEMATSLESDFMKPLLAMAIYALFSVLISYVTNKSIKLRRILTGKTLVLLENGKIFDRNLKKAHLDINEFLTQCRTGGFFNIADIQTAILETNGKISFLPMETRRPVNPSDLNLNPTKEKPLFNLIIDGKVLEDNLKAVGKNDKWLEKQIHLQGIQNISDVFLATFDSENNLSVYMKVKKPMSRDMFE